MKLHSRVTKLEKDQPTGPEKLTIYRTIVSKKPDGKLTERLATIWQSGTLFRRGKGESETAFIERVEEAQERNSQ